MGTKNENKIYYSLIIIITFVIFICSANIAFAEDRSYSIPIANFDLGIGNDGSLHVTEKINYHFSGVYHGVYRDIPQKSYEKLDNIKINVSGAYYNYDIRDNGNKKHIIVYLYSDPALTTPISDRDVTVTYDYDFFHVVNFYDDIAELQYKLWGEEWGVPVGQINAVVHLKSNEGVKYWLNPPYLSQNSSWQGSNFLVSSKSIPKNQWFEIRMVIPKNQFVSLNQGHIMNGSGLSDIERIQNDYSNWINIQTILFLILPFLIILSMIYPFYRFYRSKGGYVSFKKGFDGKLPEKDPPAIINAIYGSGISKEVGDPDINGFIATIMDLIKRRYLLVDFHSSEGNLLLKINKKNRADHLKSFEKIVLGFLKDYEKNHIIKVKDINVSLDKSHFQKKYLDWRKDVIKKLIHGRLESVYINEDKKGLYIYGFAALLGSLLIISISYNNVLPGAKYTFYASILLFFVSVLSLFMTSKTLGQWTDYGKEYRREWIAFKKYIQDSNSIASSNYIFDDYIIYGIALGVGDKVNKSLKKAFPDENKLDSKVFLFHNSQEYRNLKSEMFAGIATYGAFRSYITIQGGSGGSGGSGGGGAGGAGGGSGGGGGGAF